jgi:hypothetical protein
MRFFNVWSDNPYSVQEKNMLLESCKSEHTLINSGMKKWLVHVPPTLKFKTSALCPQSVCISYDSRRKQQFFPSTAVCFRNGEAVWLLWDSELIVKYYVVVIRASFSYWTHPIHHSQFKFVAINPLKMEVLKLLFQIINTGTRCILTTTINKGFLPYTGIQNFVSDILFVETKGSASYAQDNFCPSNYRPAVFP